MNKTPEHPRRALGRGLSSLLPARPAAAATSPETARTPHHGLAELLIELIDANPLQPRTVFQADRLSELAQSIRTNGILQPLLVRSKGDRYELVAGERRWRAAKLAGLERVPAVVQDLADDRVLEISLVENLQREDLNPIEVAQAYQRLSTELKLSHEEIAKRTGKDRTSITNMLRLLRLPKDVQLLLAEHRLSMGHARAILGLPTEKLQREVAEKVASQGMSVRQVERLVQKMTETRDPKSDEELRQQEELDPNVKAAIEELERCLGTRVRIVQKSEQRGRIEIEYYTPEDLDRVYGIIVANAGY